MRVSVVLSGLLVVMASVVSAYGAIDSRAEWISGDTKDPLKPAPVLVREFVLEKVPSRATLELAVAGWHEVTVNGCRTDDAVLSPVTCQPDVRHSSVSHEISSFLRPGTNVVEVLLGNGWFNCFTKGAWGFEDERWLAAPQICGTCRAGDVTLFVTDAAWQAYDSPIVFNALRNGEWYDARREGERRNLRPAKIEPRAPAKVVSREDAAPCRAFDPIPPACDFAGANGTRIFDFGSNRTGWCEIEVIGESGAKVSLDYDEALAPDGTNLLGHVNCYAVGKKEPRPCQHDEYTLAGRSGGEKWHPRFTYHGFRYVKVTTTGKVKLKSIRSVFVHSDFKSVGTLAIADPTFTRLQDAARRSYLSNFTGIPTDCPHREKNGWTGDAQLAVETGLWNFDARDGYRHFLRMMIDAQHADGDLSCISPASVSFGYGWAGPAWDAALFEIPWQLYRFYGDDTAAREAYPAFIKYLGFLAKKQRADGLVGYGIGDWCAPNDFNAATNLLTDSAYLYEFNRRTAFWAERFGDREAADRCRAEAARIRTAFNHEFYKGKGVYGEGQLTALAAPLFFPGLIADGAEKATVEELVRRVRAKGHRSWFGIVGAKWVPRVLAEHGYVDDAYRLFVQPECPGWAKWVAGGENTLWEHWEGHYSHNHIMYGDFSAWAFEYLAGIKVDEPGFKRHSIRPHLPDGVASFDISYRTPQGETLRVAARRDAQGKPFFRTNHPKARTVMNVVNFVRGCEPRDPKTDLVRPIAEEIALNTKYHLPNTILLQYDAMIRPDLMKTVRSAEPDRTEYGVWIEMARQLVEKVGLPWRGRKGWDWDWYINPGFLMAYTQDERAKIIDEIFREFKSHFGCWPKSVGSWLLDAWSMDYMQKKYDVKGFCICREQDNTDAYGLRGGYFNGLYYPSRRNMLSAAVDMKNAVKAPVFKMLTPDPIYNYAKSVTPKGVDSCPCTLEPVWYSGFTPSVVDWYFRVYTGPGMLNLSYMQTGQENSFGWGMIGKGLPYQIEVIARLAKEGRLDVERMCDTAERFIREHPENCPQTQVALEDWAGDRRSVWYNSKHYRANLFLSGGVLSFRDIHKMCDGFEEPFLDKVCTGWQALYFTPPVLDEYLFKTDGRFKPVSFPGRFTQIVVETPDMETLVATAKGEGVADVRVTFTPGKIAVTGVPEAVGKGIRTGVHILDFNGYKYQIGYLRKGGEAVVDLSLPEVK